MRKNISFLLLELTFIAWGSHIWGQTPPTTEINLVMDIPPVSLINFETDNKSIITYSYSTHTPGNVEQIISPGMKNQTWINYSSIVNPGVTNYIAVSISSGKLPDDVTLKLVISEDAGAGSGKTGKSVGEITLSANSQNIIIDIGSCFTGLGVNKGHMLTYKWEKSAGFSGSSQFTNEEPIAVMYTITTSQ